MRILSSVLSVTIFTVLLLSCGSSTSDQNHSNSTSKVKINNGEKWQANPETEEGIDRMQELVASFQKNNRSDYGKLKDSLQTEFKLIFERCTMIGESHNQLHNYLAPLSKHLKKMEKGTENEKQKAMEKLKNHLNSFDNYFK